MGTGTVLSGVEIAFGLASAHSITGPCRLHSELVPDLWLSWGFGSFRPMRPMNALD